MNSRIGEQFDYYRPASAVVCLLLTLVFCLPASGQEAEATTTEAILLPIPLPLDHDADLQIIGQIEQALDRFGEEVPRPILILEFGSDSETAGLSRYERCLTLARFLVSDKLRRVRTVAYVKGNVTGHAVLLALACEEIMMSSQAELGDAGGHEEFVDAAMVAFYQDIAKRRRTLSPEMALSMLDPSAGFFRVSTIGGEERYVNAKELQQLKDAKETVNSRTIFGSGQLARFSGIELRRQYGYVSRLVEDREQLEAALAVPITEFSSNQDFDSTQIAARIELRGRVTAEKVNRIVRSLGDQRNDDIKRIVMVIDSPGGSAKDSLRLAHALAAYANEDDRQVIGFVDGAALADASWIALACARLTMRTESVLGGPGDWHPSARDLKDLTKPLQKLANELDMTSSFLTAMIDENFQLFEYVHQTTGAKKWYGDLEHQALDSAELWKRGDRVETGVGLTTERARQLGVCKDEFAGFDQLKQRYQLHDDLEILEENPFIARLESLATSPWFVSTLLSVAFFAMIGEASAPGIGVPGFLSGLAFLLFFWAQFLNGSAGWLEVILFVGGFVAILLELIVIPGFGVFGFGGGIMILTSIVLASQTFVFPQNAYQVAQVPQSMYGLIAALASTFFGALVMRKYLADVPYLRRLMLQPLEARDVHELEQREAIVDFDHLANKTGIATTPLRPAGKARFGDQVVDVTCERESIDRGESLSVASIQGNKVIVRRLHRD
ncbi:MAG TPA: hypothetical protein EYQ75_13595 [Planctomycetaceae bacterium]|nr:hypothetical protein [Planctomycetaceae bacterium]